MAASMSFVFNSKGQIREVFMAKRTIPHRMDRLKIIISELLTLQYNISRKLFYYPHLIRPVDPRKESIVKQLKFLLNIMLVSSFAVAVTFCTVVIYDGIVSYSAL
ncbi:putative vacuolar ATP synthase subunit f protein [Corchorus olitorius]|uniref:Vacuolar ATP synthase subunit f protein n=1 Tax=Corchorus olitorius TaxID=93759 RepID=A0A1R3KJB1_9ROSI|nr:putative vacuolar ATP synthase subunit f protein [Corchorus olitorius]